MGKQFTYLLCTELYSLPYNIVSTIQWLRQIDMDLIPTKGLEENTRLSLEGKTVIQQKEQTSLASTCLNGLEEGARPLMSKTKMHSKVQCCPHYTIKKAANCLPDVH